MTYAIPDPEEARLQKTYDDALAREEDWIKGRRRLLLQGTSVECLTVQELLEFIQADKDKPRDFAEADKALKELRAYRAKKAVNKKRS